MMDSQLMVDIETLALDNHAVVCTVGWCVFDYHGIVSSGEYLLDWPSQTDRTIDANTVAWWLSQDSGARSSLVGEDYTTLPDLRNSLTSMYRDCSNIWASPPQFDLCILGDLIGPFWLHDEPRDVRPMADLFRHFQLSLSDSDLVTYELTHHKAEHDAIRQALIVSAVWRHIGYKR